MTLSQVFFIIYIEDVLVRVDNFKIIIIVRFIWQNRLPKIRKKRYSLKKKYIATWLQSLNVIDRKIYIYLNISNLIIYARGDHK